MSAFIDNTLIIHNRLLLELSRFIGSDEKWSYVDVAKKILTIAVQGLQLPRVSIWSSSNDLDSLECLALYVDGAFVDTTSITLRESDYPNYFNALKNERFIVAVDAHTHQDTAEFSKEYLTPLNIYSMLDAPIRKDGKIVGILCCEQTSRTRAWSLSEQSFAAMLADSACRALAEESARNSIEALKRSIYTDALTSLANRTKLLLDIEESQNAALALFDIDGFTDINDFYGYETGSHILREVAKNIAAFWQTQGSLYRYNSDKFALLANKTTQAEFLSQVEMLLERLNTHVYRFEEFAITLKLTTVLSFEPKENIIHSIDILLKEAKKQNAHILVYDKALKLEEKISNNILWNKKIREALLEDRFTTFYQPVYDNKSGKIEKYETLVRMIENDGSIVSPYAFLEIAKRSKQYISITKLVINKSFETFAPESNHFSINLSVEDILSEEIRALLFEKMKESRFHHRVIFEIVESEEIEREQEVLRFIEEMKAFGCAIAIDDFGTGYSNFEKLCKLTPSYIKIDGSMIRDIDTNLDNEELVTTIIEFAKKRHLKTIAEFVHSKEVFHKVCALGIDYSQGYYIGEPQPTLLKEFSEKL